MLFLPADNFIREFRGTPDSGPPSKRASKRVSFIDEGASQPLVKHEASPPAEQ